MLPLLAAALLTQTSSVPAAKREIQACYDRWSKAYMAQDVDTLLSILAPDYVLINAKKERTTLAQYAAYLRLKKRSGYKDPMKTSTEIRSLVFRGADADVDAIETMVTPASDPKSNRPTWCYHRHQYLDVWRKNEGAWTLHSTTTLKESTEFKPRH